MQLSDKIVLVTGAAQGIGAAICKEFAAKGPKAIVCVDIKNSHETVDAVNALGCLAMDFVGDVTDKDFREFVFSTIKVQCRDVPKILVPAAGITRDNLAVKFNKSTNEYNIYDEKAYELVVKVNQMAPQYWAMEMTRAIVEQGHIREMGTLAGAVVFIGSISAQGNMGQISYSSTKAALSAAASTLRSEWKKYGIKVVVIHPGFTNTEMVATIPEKTINMLLGQTQLGRLIRPQEIAEAVVFAATNDAIYQDIRVDAGYHKGA